jgi:Late embryogenesis abundant (LEA) group 1
MQGMKEKMQDMTSTVKEKVKEGTANVQGIFFSFLGGK